MIDETLIEKALGQIVTASASFPTVLFGNGMDEEDRTYIIVSLVPGVVDDPTLAQTMPVWGGFYVGTIVTPLGQFETEGRTLAKAFGDLFASGSRITMDDGAKVLVTGHPQPVPPYRDGGSYRHPVRVPIQVSN